MEEQQMTKDQEEYELLQSVYGAVQDCRQMLQHRGPRYDDPQIIQFLYSLSFMASEAEDMIDDRVFELEGNGAV